MDTLGHADAPAACIVMESSGRAGPSVTGNASRREGHAEKERHPLSGENVGNPGQPAQAWKSSAEMTPAQGF